MNYPLSPVRGGWIVLGLAVLGYATDFAWTQQLKTAAGLKKPFDETASRRNKLIAGEEKFPTAEDKKIAEVAAHYYIYRITIGTKPTEAWHKHAVAVQGEFSTFVNYLISPDRNNNNRAFINMLGPPLVASMKDVLSLDIRENATVIVNACMMLPTMARLKQDYITDYLVGLVNDEKQSDIARLYALKALKETMPVRPFDELDEFDLKSTSAKKARDLKSLDALTKYIERPVKEELAPEETAAVRYLRREAIIALAHAGIPAVNIARKTRVVEGGVAPTLLQVVANSALQPAASLQEKIEASLGLCTMKHAYMQEYQPDLAVYLVGKTIYELATEYNKDYVNFAVKAPNKKLPTIGWKIESRRFEAGLKELIAQAKGTSARGKAEDLETRAKPILVSISKYEQPDGEKLLELNKLVRTMQPKSGAVFKTPNSPAIMLP